MEVNPVPLVYISAILLLATSCIGVYGLEPSFDVPVINVTVQEGDDAMLPCSVENLGDKKVVWTDKWATLLTLEFTRIIDDPRISVERPFTKDWNLHIRKTTYNDRGEYTCQINTKPIKVKKVNLIVQVPSKIINEYSSKDTRVREGETVTLTCNVTGVPPPEVTWYKQPSEGHEAKERIGTSGEVLVIHNVSRYCDGTYECVAYNNVDPAVTRQIKVFVKFPPEVNLNAKRMGQYVGRETILDCEITAYPFGVMLWRFRGEEIMQTKTEKYNVEIYSGNQDGKRKTLSLRIRDIQPEDFGDYECFASNIIGEDVETMTLYDYSELDRTPKTTPTLITFDSTTHFLKTDRNIGFVTMRPPFSRPGVSENTPYAGEFGAVGGKGTRHMASSMTSLFSVGLIFFRCKISRFL